MNTREIGPYVESECIGFEGLGGMIGLTASVGMVGLVWSFLVFAWLEYLTEPPAPESKKLSAELAALAVSA